MFRFWAKQQQKTNGKIPGVFLFNKQANIRKSDRYIRSIDRLRRPKTQQNKNKTKNNQQQQQNEEQLI